MAETRFQGWIRRIGDALKKDTTEDWAISEKDVVTYKDHPTMLATANEIKRIIDDRLKNDRYDTEPIPVSQHVLVWAEYWLRWACEHIERCDE